MNQSRGQISEQAYMTQRGIQNQAQARGLGSSGLTNLANFQAQQQAGQAISALEQQNQMVQSEAMNVRRSLLNELSQATRAADLAYAQQMAESDERAFQQEQSLREFDINFLSTLGELARNEQGDFAHYLANAYYSGELDTSSEGLASLIGRMDPLASFDPAEGGHITLDSGSVVRRTGGKLMEVLGPLLTAAGAAATATGIGAPIGMLGIGAGAMTTAKSFDENRGWSGGATVTLTLGDGSQIVTTSREDAINKLTERFSSNANIRAGRIKIEVSPYGTPSFKVPGDKTNYKTLQDAENALRARVGRGSQG